MAKGDGSVNGGVNGAAPPVAPKIDQYSVMHKIMDAFGGNQPAQNIAPSPDMQMPNPVMSGGVQSPAPIQMGGRFGGGMGMPRAGEYNPGNPPPNVPMIGGVGPSDPQTMLRRNMNGTRTFGQ
jgi:hypothetical protein